MVRVIDRPALRRGDLFSNLMQMHKGAKLILSAVGIWGLFLYYYSTIQIATIVVQTGGTRAAIISVAVRLRALNSLCSSETALLKL